MHNVWNRRVRALLTLAMLLAHVSEPAWAQSIFSHGAAVLSRPQNPLGPRALYLGDTLYRIHGTNRPGSMGGAVSHGCFACTTHIVDLFEKVQFGANGYVVP